MRTITISPCGHSPLFQRGAGGDLLFCVWPAVVEIPPSPPFAKGGTVDAATAISAMAYEKGGSQS